MEEEKKDSPAGKNRFKIQVNLKKKDTQMLDKRLSPQVNEPQMDELAMYPKSFSAVTPDTGPLQPKNTLDNYMQSQHTQEQDENEE